jgi:hypothetical protein
MRLKMNRLLQGSDNNAIAALIAQDPLSLAIVNVITYIAIMGKIRIVQRSPNLHQRFRQWGFDEAAG